MSSADPVPDHAPPLDEAALARQFETVRAQLHMRKQRLTAASGALPSAYLAWLLNSHATFRTLFLWWLTLLAVDATSMVHTTVFLKRSSAHANPGPWLNRQFALQSTAGLVWGSSCLWALSDMQGTLSVAIVLVAVSAVGAIGLMFYRRAVILNSISIFAVPLALLLSSGNSVHLRLFFGVFVLLISFNFYIWEASSQLLSGLRQTIRADALAHDLQNAFTQIHTLATLDELTGCLNRREGMQKLDHALHWDRRRESRPTCVILLDIDHFKHINDTHGHPGGDVVLRHVARTMQEALRDGDVLSRIGGEEFMVLARGKMQTGTVIAQRLRTAVEDTPVNLSENTPVKVTVSLGVTLVQADENIDAVLQRADDALYEAKRGGRNQVVVAP